MKLQVIVVSFTNYIREMRPVNTDWLEMLKQTFLKGKMPNYFSLSFCPKLFVIPLLF